MSSLLFFWFIACLFALHTRFTGGKVPRFVMYMVKSPLYFGIALAVAIPILLAVHG